MGQQQLPAFNQRFTLIRRIQTTQSPKRTIVDSADEESPARKHSHGVAKLVAVLRVKGGEARDVVERARGRIDEPEMGGADVEAGNVGSVGASHNQAVGNRDRFPKPAR